MQTINQPRNSLIERINAHTEFNSEQGIQEQEDLELQHMLADLELLKEKPQHKSLEVPALRRKDLQQLSYPALENTYYGLFNISIPQEIADVMNPDEVIAKLHASGGLKRYNRHLSLPSSFLELVLQMDRVSYQFIGNMAKQCKKPFPNKPGDQRKRLSTLDPEITQRFVTSFFRRYVPSKREDPSDPNSFYDPNIDGRSKTVYVNDIYRILKPTSSYHQ